MGRWKVYCFGWSHHSGKSERVRRKSRDSSRQSSYFSNGESPPFMAGEDVNYSSYTDLDFTTNFHLCGANASKYYFNHQFSNNSVVMDLKVVIPDNANAGTEKTVTFTFNGESSG